MRDSPKTIVRNMNGDYFALQIPLRVIPEDMQRLLHNIVPIVPMLYCIFWLYIRVGRQMALGATNFKVSHKVYDHFGIAAASAFSG
jgi:hypothetical protein